MQIQNKPPLPVVVTSRNGKREKHSDKQHQHKNTDSGHTAHRKSWNLQFVIHHIKGLSYKKSCNVSLDLLGFFFLHKKGVTNIL